MKCMVKNLSQPCTNFVDKGEKSCIMKTVLALHLSGHLTRTKHLSAYHWYLAIELKPEMNFDKKNYE